MVSVFVGSGAPDWIDGTGIQAALNQPFGVALDAAGNLLVAEHSNHRVRRVTPSRGKR